jgi:hypothetical protein
MLDIRVNSVTIPLPVNHTLTRDMETTLFNKENDVFDFTYPIDVPLTSEAVRALGYPNSLANPDVKRVYQGELIIDGLYVSPVTVKVLNVDLNAQTCRISLFGQYADLAQVFGTKKVNELELGGYRIIPGDVDILPSYSLKVDTLGGTYSSGAVYVECNDSVINYMTKIANGTIVDDYLFPSAADLNSNVAGLMDGGENLINIWDAIDRKYVDADLYNFLAGADFSALGGKKSIFVNEQRHFWVPFFRLKFVLRKCFEELGITVTGNVFSDAKFNDLTLFNTKAINEGYRVGNLVIGSTDKVTVTVGRQMAYFSPKDHVPKMSIIEFTSEIAKRYNWQYSYDPLSRTVRILDNRLLITSPQKVVDLSTKANPKPIANFEDSDSFQKGYEFSFESDNADSAITEDVKDDIGTFTNRGSVNTSVDIVAAVASPAINDVVYVRNENAWYQYGVDSWAFYSHNLSKFKTSTQDGLQTVSTKIVSPPMKGINIQYINRIGPTYPDWTKYMNEYQVFPFSKMGMELYGYSYIDVTNDNGKYPGGVTVAQSKLLAYAYTVTQNLTTPALPHIVTSLGFRSYLLPSTYTYPMASSAPYDCRGNAVSVYSGCWHTPDNMGLYEDWWLDFVKYVAATISVDWLVQLDAVTYNNIDLNTTTFMIDGLRWVCKAAKIVMPFPNESTLTLVRT